MKEVKQNVSKCIYQADDGRFYLILHSLGVNNANAPNFYQTPAKNSTLQIHYFLLFD